MAVADVPDHPPGITDADVVEIHLPHLAQHLSDFHRVTDAELILKDDQRSGDDVGHQGLGTETHHAGHNARAGQQGHQIHPEGIEHPEQRHEGHQQAPQALEEVAQGRHVLGTPVEHHLGGHLEVGLTEEGRPILRRAFAQQPPHDPLDQSGSQQHRQPRHQENHQQWGEGQPQATAGQQLQRVNQRHGIDQISLSTMTQRTGLVLGARGTSASTTSSPAVAIQGWSACQQARARASRSRLR